MGEATGTTAICRIEDGLVYRGYPVAELVETCRFEEVVHLLVHHDLPTARQLADFEARVTTARRLPDSIAQLFESLPRWTTPLDALRTAVSALGHFDQDDDDDSPEANARKAERLIAQFPVVIADFYRVHREFRPLRARQNLSHSANLLFMLRDTEATPEEVAALDAAMILAAEYELSPSAYAARVITSTGADFYSAVTGALGALRGARAGAGSQNVLADLDRAANAATVEGWATEAFQTAGVAGFGNQVAVTGDPRPRLLKPYVQTVARIVGQVAERLEEIAETIEQVAAREHGLQPTISWPSARLYRYLGLEGQLFPALFAASRVAGWSAHIIEQSDLEEMIRPRAAYAGPGDRPVVPLAGRTSTEFH